MDVPRAIESDVEALTAFQIYAECRKSMADKRLAIENAAHSLTTQVLRSHNPGGCIYSSVDVLRYFSQEAPSALDMGLDIFRKAATGIPDTVRHRYGSGPSGAENILRWYLVESATFFQSNVPPQGLGREGVGKDGADDSSNLTFKRSDIADSKSTVLRKLDDWQKERLDIIVMLAMLGRCHSKGFARVNRGDHIGDHAVTYTDNALDHQKPGTPLWTKADFVGCCVLLRACAKSLIETLPPAVCDSTVSRWKEELASYLHSDSVGRNEDDDFAIKLHAARALADLENGAEDEETSVLFRSADWIF